jgi:hypothetical protein
VPDTTASGGRQDRQEGEKAQQDKGGEAVDLFTKSTAVRRVQYVPTEPRWTRATVEPPLLRQVESRDDGSAWSTVECCIDVMALSVVGSPVAPDTFLVDHCGISSLVEMS